MASETLAPSPRLRGTTLGIVYLAVSAVCFSLAGLFTLLITTDVWTILCVRGLVAGCFIAMLIMVQQGRNGLTDLSGLLSAPGLVAVTASTVAMFFNLSAYRHTDVANVVLIYSTAPFIAAGLAWWLLGERATRRVLIASAFAVVGAAVIIGGSLANGNLLGDFYAGVMTTLMALMIVAVRWGKDLPMSQMACASALLSCLATLPMADLATVDGRSLALLVAFGVCQLGLGLLFFTLGSQLVNPSHAALISALDVPLAPLWVWIAFATIPPALTFLGGAIIIGAVLSTLIAPPDAQKSDGG